MRSLSWLNISRLWRSSLQRRLALAFGGVSMLMMLGLAGLLLIQQHHFLDKTSLTRANRLANVLVHSSSTWVLANDLAGLEEVLQGYQEAQNLQRAWVLSPQGQVLASTHHQEIGLYVNDPISRKMLSGPPEAQILLANDDLIDVAAPILVNQRLVGWARIELDQKATQANLRAVATTSLQFIVIAALVTLIVSMLLAKSLIARLRALMGVATAIERGSRSERYRLENQDEICQLGRSINNMLDTLVASEQQLDRLNSVYAAWTECVATIVREADEHTLLQRICEILVEKIKLRLAFVGIVDADGWLTIEASSDSDSAYLKNLRISIDAHRPEGQGPMGQAVRNGKPSIFNDFMQSPETLPWRQRAEQTGIHAAAAFPLLRHQRVIGGLAVYSTEINYFNEDIISLLNGLINDISYALDNFDRERLRQQTETELALAASVFDNSQEGIMITDAHKIIRRVNDVFSLLTGYPATEAIGKTPEQLAASSQNAKLFETIWATLDSQHYWQGEVNGRRRDGEIYPQWLTINQVLNKTGQVTHYVAAFSDITERKLNEERIYRLAFYDPLTDLPNRRLLVDRLGEALVANQRKQRYGALMFMDLDRFKILNDTQGHDLGDQLLIEAGKRITRCVREVDTVARLGGDEFVILLEDLAEDAEVAAMDAQKIGNKVLSALNQVYLLHHCDAQGQTSMVEHHSSASIGVSLFFGAVISSEEVLKQADMAMYQAKQAGRNTLRLFDPDMQCGLNQRAALEADLRQALQQHQFQLYYQIQVDQQRQAVGAEALLRWEHPLRGFISPLEFIPLAEESGQILAIGAWVLAEACKTLLHWAQHPSTEHLVLAINVSAKQLGQPDFVEQVRALLQKTGANPRRLKLEITESTVLESLEQTIHRMQELRALGLSFAMDDFGTGFSSLAYLQRLPLAQLKIDRSFVCDLQQNSNDAAIIRTILALGTSLDLQVVAEGVETEQQYHYLLANACPIFQGYLFGKPATQTEFEQRLRSKT